MDDTEVYSEYDPSIGRFLQRDPIGYTDSMNLYQYVNNNSINYIDPFGLTVAIIPKHPSFDNYYPSRNPSFSERIHQIRQWGHRTYPGESNSYQRHFAGSYIGTKEYGSWPSRLAGYGNEVQGLILYDLPDVLDGVKDNPWAWNWEDFLANEDGIWSAERDDEGKKKKKEYCELPKRGNSGGGW